MKTVVVGLSTGTIPAEPLSWAADYCRLSGKELVGVVAYQPTQSELPPDWYEEELAAARKQAQAALDSITPTIAYRLEIRYGDPRTVIPHLAHDEDAAMVVVGARGSGGFHGLGLGSVAHHLAHHLLVPLVVVPALGGPLRRGLVVVGLDGSPGSAETLRWAVSLAQTVGGSVIAVYASDPMAMSYPHPRGATIADQLEGVVRQRVANVAASGVDITLVVEVAHPVEALTSVADRYNGSAVVVGHKGAGHVRGLLLGRVPAQLPFRAHRPVAIVPRPASE